MDTFPKPLVRIAPGIRIIDLITGQLLQMGIRHFWVAGGPDTAAVCARVASVAGGIASVSPLNESRRGTAMVLRENLGRLPPVVLVANGDTIYLDELQHLSRPVAPPALASFGIGKSATSGRGNVLVDGTSVVLYDKAGTRGTLSDAGFHVLNLSLAEALLRDAHGMLEDGVLQQLAARRVPIWHRPVTYLDPGTEEAVLRARRCLRALPVASADASSSRRVIFGAVFELLRDEFGVELDNKASNLTRQYCGHAAYGSLAA
jgi:hypothetical protein